MCVFDINFIDFVLDLLFIAHKSRIVELGERMKTGFKIFWRSGWIWERDQIYVWFSIGEILIWILEMAGNLKINNSNFPSKKCRKKWRSWICSTGLPPFRWLRRRLLKSRSQPKSMLYLMFSNDFEDDPLHKILTWRDPLIAQQVPAPGTFAMKEVSSIVSDDQG